MASFRQRLLNNLKTELFYITLQNGYETKIKNVFVNRRDPTQIQEWPSVSFFYEDCDEVETDSSGEMQDWLLVVKFIVFVKPNLDPEQKGDTQQLIEKALVDMHNFLYRGKAISKQYTSSLKLMDGYQGMSVTNQNNFVEDNFGAALITLKVHYKEDAQEITNENVSATTNLSNA